MLQMWTANADRMRRWTPIPADIAQKVEERIERAQQGLRSGNLLLLGLHLGVREPYFGDISLDGIDGRSPEIGFHVDEGYEGRGYVTAAVTATLGVAFGMLRLEAVRADAQPVNERAKKLLDHCGFKRDGRSIMHKVTGMAVPHDVYVLTRKCWSERGAAEVGFHTQSSRIPHASRSR